MNTSILPVLLIAIFTLGGCGQLPQSTPAANTDSAPATQAQSTPVASKGQQLFITHCASCHQGMSQTPSPNAVVLNSRVLAKESAFKALLRQPYSPMMPAFGPEVLSDEDVHELYGYLQAEKAKAPAN
jgi:mono/diheme cytochrome c family protein